MESEFESLFENAIQSQLEEIENNTIRELYLPYAHIGGDQELECFKNLLPLLLKNTSIQILNLSENDIGDTFSEDLARVLLKNSSIQELILSHNNIGDKGIEFLCSALLENTTLQRLYLVSNQFGEKGVVHLAQALLKTTSLQYLCLDYNDIGVKAVEALSLALVKNTSLQRLDMRCNNIDSIGMVYLAQALLKNTTLQHLDLRGNLGMRNEGEVAIRQALKKNPSLKEIRGLELVEQVENKITLGIITLGIWRREIQERRKKFQRIMGKFLEEVNLIHCILQMESAFPFTLKVLASNRNNLKKYKRQRINQ